MENEVVPAPFFDVESAPFTFFSSLEFGGGSALLPKNLISKEKNSGDLFEMQKRFMLLELQSLTDRYRDAFHRLQLKLSDLDALKEENLLLASENLELLMLVREEETSFTAPFSAISPSSSSSTVVGFGAEQLRSANLQAERGKEPISGEGEADTGVAIPNASRSALPKSISIRSNGFLAARYPPPSAVNRCAVRLRLPATAPLQEGDGEEEVEVDAYNQGTAKTELCNNWGEMEWCPYEERCRFAHGIEELRPVIRHPRYKTQPCRMLSGAGGCPYGHRCHFRHDNLSESHPY